MTSNVFSGTLDPTQSTQVFLKKRLFKWASVRLSVIYVLSLDRWQVLVVASVKGAMPALRSLVVDEEQLRPSHRWRSLL